MQVCSVVAGNTAPSASGIPFSPSVTAIRMSLTPRVLRSLNTFIQNFAPSVVSIHRPENLARAVAPHAQRQIHRLVAHHALFADLHPQSVEEHHRIDRLQRPGLPGRHLRQHPVGHRADQVGTDLGAVGFKQITPGSRAPSGRAHTAPRCLSSKPVKRRACLGTSSGSKLPSRSRGVSIRTCPSPVSTVLARAAVALVGRRSRAARAPARSPGDGPAPPSSAASISACLKATPPRLIASPVIGPVRKWATSSFGIDGSLATSRDTLLRSARHNALLGVRYASHTELRTGSRDRLRAFPPERKLQQRSSVSFGGHHPMNG